GLHTFVHRPRPQLPPPHALEDRPPRPNPVDGPKVVGMAIDGPGGGLDGDAEAGPVEVDLDVVHGEAVAGEEHIDVAVAHEMCERGRRAGVHDGRPDSGEDLATALVAGADA